ncbi:FtsK/SpoIIIE domain-containing protein [Peribacillus sp. B-H-3]|uniref:FtsK/SpoIIIE domain-containing protein n=1 Tax=Peribacillus sp. B-H-3 TaxID=3400420 RepID=UPI003B010446
MKLPIVCGVDTNGGTVVYDKVEHPHLLIAVETGSGKSTQLRSVLTSLITTLRSERLKLYLCDLKRSEFRIFRRVEHVECVLVSPSETLPILQHLRNELTKRGDLLDTHELSHIDDLPDRPPYIILYIDGAA